jgi:hypothetical protein
MKSILILPQAKGVLCLFTPIKLWLLPIEEQLWVYYATTNKSTLHFTVSKPPWTVSGDSKQVKPAVESKLDTQLDVNILSKN